MSQNGVEMLESYVKDIQNLPRKEMNSFLGFTGYYRGFIPKYSALTNRMNSMRKAEKFDWSEIWRRIFSSLKPSLRPEGYKHIRILTLPSCSYLQRTGLH